ncbi:hypothetical protein Q7P37_006457 [Cladosporium fusiforme]
MYRHTSLFIKFANGNPSTLVHVVGPPGEFNFEHRDSYDPSQSLSLAKTVDVGFLSVQASRGQMIQIMRTIPVQNEEREFNCQMWVETALRKLKEMGMLASNLYTKGVDGMVDAIAEAEDEED